MSPACRREAEVLAAYRPQGDAARRAALAAHLGDCPACRRAAQLSSALAALAAEGPGFELPDPHRIYWRSQVLGRLAEREEATDRATRPLLWVQVLAALVAAAVGALALGTVGVDLVGEALRTPATGMGGGGVLPLTLALGSALLAVVGWWGWMQLVER